MKTKILLTVLGLSLTVTAFSQQNMTLYQMRDILQSNSLNPSIVSECRWNIGVPFLGNISLAASSPIAYNSLGIDQTEGNYGESIINALNDINLASANGSLNLLTVGYRNGDSYYQFTMNERGSFLASFNKEPLYVLFTQDEQFKDRTTVENISLSAMYYREYGFNYARALGENTWVGVRAKLLFGRLSAFGMNNSVSFRYVSDSSPLGYHYDVTSNAFVRTSMPAEVEDVGTSGNIKFRRTLTAGHFIVNPTNVGGGIDLGFNTVLDNGLRLSASLLNLGMLSWSSNLHTFHQKANVTYSGASVHSWDEFRDSVKSVIKLEYEPGSNYTQWLSPEFIVGANYPVHDNIRVGLTAYTQIASVGLPWALTAVAMTDNLDKIYGALSYTVTNNSFVNIGIGAGTTIGPVNVHLMTDNLIAAFSYRSQKYATIQFGVNFTFGCDVDNSSSRKRYSSVPCPSFKRTASHGAIPCSK
jgi:hypothetical protein